MVYPHAKTSGRWEVSWVQQDTFHGDDKILQIDRKRIVFDGNYGDLTFMMDRSPLDRIPPELRSLLTDEPDETSTAVDAVPLRQVYVECEKGGERVLFTNAKLTPLDAV